ncbi:hypothetical protein FISHEDRAFT_59066 [Fistulina hepatica ATCC 64428]|uniref:Uncharacterized protein n=1 Tax=Fistulina hepatica ATCC 64428 TaxID=1128425 RepID=A0A0D7AC55_9AGAR|nr:hypothetical protein FISHEDRAFT_59066 [Fistulina hepatica ATCC 64428]
MSIFYLLDEWTPRTIKLRMDPHGDPKRNVIVVFRLQGIPSEDAHVDIPQRMSGCLCGNEAERDTVRASMENDVLPVTFPKTNPEDAPKRITVPSFLFTLAAYALMLDVSSTL